MPTYPAEAFTLRTYPFGEADKLVVAFSREHGLIRAVAKGARKTGSKLAGRTEPLLFDRMLLAKGKNLDILTQCVTLETYSELRRDYSRLIQGLHIAELTMVALPADMPHPEIFDCFKLALSALCVQDPESVSAWYSLRLLDELGYRLELEECVGCGSPIDAYCGFSVKEGGVLCGSCVPIETFSSSDLDCLRVLREQEIGEAGLVNPHAQRILQECLACRLETRLRTLDFIQAG